MGDVVTLPASGRSTGREIIDRMARSMAHAKGRDFSRMTRPRQDQLRGQARAALRAFRPADEPVNADIDAARASWGGTVISTSPNSLLADVRDYIDQVLK